MHAWNSPLLLLLKLVLHQKIPFCPQLLKTFTLMINQFGHYYLHSNLSNINAFIASRADILSACHTIL